MPRNLSHTLKQKYLPLIIQRDNGFNCRYCNSKLDVKTAVFEHLNNRRVDNRLENLVLACQSCNINKINDGDMQEFAMDTLRENEVKIFVGEKNLLEVTQNPSNNTEPSKEIAINVTNYDITQNYITEIIDNDGSIEFKEALNSCVYLCKRKTGHGSQNSVRSYINTLTSIVAPFQITRNGKMKIIVKRVNRIDLSRNQVPENIRQSN